MTKIKRSQLNKLTRIIVKETKRQLQEEGDQPLPSQVKIRMQKFIEAVQEANLTRQKQYQILDAVVSAMGLDKTKLNVFTQKIKKDL